MKIVADSAIPYLDEAFEGRAQVLRLPGAAISRADLMDADALLTRTRTKVDAALLEGTPIQFVGSATIGTDHIDTEWLRSRGIAFSNAPGCNSGAVMQYVFTTLYSLAVRKGIVLKGRTLGVVGVGHVGSKVADLALRLGFNVALCDPPRREAEGDSRFIPLEELLAVSDIVTLHVPLDKSTRAMADADFFSRMKDGAVFINSSRGDVVLTEALTNAYKRLGGVILDVFPGEPDRISPTLIQTADVVTPHIAGYSLEGKANATAAVVQALAEHFGIDELKDFHPATGLPSTIAFPLSRDEQLTACLLTSLFPFLSLDRSLRENPSAFEELRNNYPLRHEFTFKQKPIKLWN